MEDKQMSRFFQYVSTEFGNCPYRMLEAFSNDIAQIAELVSVDWWETKDKVRLSGIKHSGRQVVGLTSQDQGRIWVIGFHNTHRWLHQGNEQVVNYPSVRFQNFRVHFPEPVLFDGYQALMNAYKRQKTYSVVYRPKIKVKNVDESIESLRQDAVEKDMTWLSRLKPRQTPCPYFEAKGIPHFHQLLHVFQGQTTKGPAIGEFTAVPIWSVVTWQFCGLQRYYKGGQKVYRKNINPSGACVVCPHRQPVDGEWIIIQESVADTIMANILSNVFCIASLFADNLVQVVRTLRAACPTSPMLLVADQDVESGKGLEVCENAVRLVEGNIKLALPPQGKDLTHAIDLMGKEAVGQWLASLLMAS